MFSMPVLYALSSSVNAAARTAGRIYVSANKNQKQNRTPEFRDGRIYGCREWASKKPPNPYDVIQ